MQNLFIEKTSNTPLVNFDYDQGLLRLEGRSIPEDPGDFYEKLFDWVEKYFKNPKTVTRVDLELEYVNSGSSKYILGLLKIIKQRHCEGSECIINWYYEEDDEALQELGEHYKSILKIPFNLIETY